MKRKNSLSFRIVILPALLLFAAPSAFAQEPPPPPCNIYLAGGNHTGILKETDGSIWLWGDNTYGQLGDGTTNSRNVPLPLEANDWKAFFLGADFSLAIKNDGTLWAWGHNNFGQLGLGDFDDRHVPTQVGTDTAWLDVVTGSGSYHAFALKYELFTAELWGWGLNTDGQVGNGTSGDTINVPVQIADPDGSGIWFDTRWGYTVGTSSIFPSLNVVKSTGANHTLMLTASGELWVWGGNDKGQLGTGDFNPRLVPTHINNGVILDSMEIFIPYGDTVTGMGYMTVSAGDHSSLGLCNPQNSSIMAPILMGWGDNSKGQLGDGTFTDYNIPTSTNINNWGSVQTQNGYSTLLPGEIDYMSGIAPSEYPGLFMSGLNDAGQLGDGTNIDKGIFTRTSSELWGQTDQAFYYMQRSPALGKKHVIGAKGTSVDTLYVWGDNTYGQLGLGDNNPRPTPTPLIFPAGYIIVTGMQLGDTTITINVGDTLEVKSYGNPAGNYTSDNPSIATVDPVTGKITAVGVGTTRIHRPFETCASDLTDEDIGLVITVELPANNFIPVNPHIRSRIAGLFSNPYNRGLYGNISDIICGLPEEEVPKAVL